MLAPSRAKCCGRCSSVAARRRIEAERPEQASNWPDLHRPDLIVLDAESDHSATRHPTDDFASAAGRSDTPIVILGKLRQLRGQIPAGQIVAKPYHYGPLIRKIDGLLAAA